MGTGLLQCSPMVVPETKAGVWLLASPGSKFEYWHANVAKSYTSRRVEDNEQLMRRFAEWRAVQPVSYKEAYIALCLPTILAPLVQLQLLHKNNIGGPSERGEFVFVPMRGVQP